MVWRIHVVSARNFEAAYINATIYTAKTYNNRVNKTLLALLRVRKTYKTRTRVHVSRAKTKRELLIEPFSGVVEKKVGAE